MSTIQDRCEAAVREGTALREYYHGGTVDRWCVAPVGLGLGEAFGGRVSRLYRSELPARRFRLGLERRQEVIGR